MRRAAVAVLVLAIAIGGMATAHVKVVVSGWGLAQLLWHDDEAFLFLATGRSGWNVNYLWWLTAHLLPYGIETTDSRPGMMVARMTSEIVATRELAGSGPPDLIAFDGAVSAGRVPWTGDRFDTSNRRPVPKAFLVNQTPQHFSDVDGWSKRSFFLPRDSKDVIEFTLRGQAARLILSSIDKVATIDLERPGRPVERLWTADRRLRWVGSAEYDAFFEQAPPPAGP